MRGCLAWESIHGWMDLDAKKPPHSGTGCTEAEAELSWCRKQARAAFAKCSSNGAIRGQFDRLEKLPESPGKEQAVRYGQSSCTCICTCPSPGWNLLKTQLPRLTANRVKCHSYTPFRSAMDVFGCHLSIHPWMDTWDLRGTYLFTLTSRLPAPS